MGKGSKSKGSKGEREVARLFSVWWTGNEEYETAPMKQLPLRPTPSSGGWAEGNSLKGDLVSVKPETRDFCCTVEVKYQERWSFDALMGKQQTTIHKWWKQTVEEASANYSIPILVFRKNLHPWYVAVNHLLASRVLSRRTMSIWLPHIGIVITKLDDFLAVVNKEDLRG